LIHLLHTAYRHRNTPLARRVLLMLLTGWWRLIREDIRSLSKRTPSAVSLAVPFHGLRGCGYYLFRRLTLKQFATLLESALVRRADRQDAGKCAVVVSATTAASFAMDIDTRRDIAEVLKPEHSVAEG
ncbi:MAG: hypothetical protein KDD44_06050, partial [Bdellovibrionales bacterium]|nr:hypothetical protein [Bdellovibrionales bacterium]